MSTANFMGVTLRRAMSPPRRKPVLVIPPPVGHVLHLHRAATSWNSRYISINLCRRLAPCQHLRDTTLSNIIPEIERCATGRSTPPKTQQHMLTLTPPQPGTTNKVTSTSHGCNPHSCNPNTIIILPRTKGAVNKQMEVCPESL